MKNWVSSSVRATLKYWDGGGLGTPTGVFSAYAYKRGLRDDPCDGVLTTLHLSYSQSLSARLVA